MDLLKKNKKYGFTLIELIVVIAIIGIILILALPQVSKIQEANRDRKFEVYKESIVRGAKLYIDSNAKDLFGNNNSGCITLKYSDLENRSLVKDFASDTITCSDDAETYVEVRKVNKNYKYAVSIVCRENEDIVYEDRIDDTFACENKPDTEAPLVTITPEKYNWTQSKNIKVKIKVEDPSGLNRNIGIKYYWTDSSGKKVGKTYQYNYKNKKGTSKVSYQIPEKNVPTASGQYKLVVEPWSSSTTSGIQDALGNVSLLSKEAGLYKIDNVKPTCGKAEGEKKNWTNQNFRINQECKDDASGCVQNPYSKEFTKTTTTHTFTIKDNAGNSRTCTVDVYLDKSKPNVPTSKIRKDNSKGAVQTNQNKWTSNTLWWGEFKSTGSTSPIDHFEYSENCTGTKSGNLSSSYTYNKDKNSTYCIRAVNEAGTVSDWSSKYYFKIDKTAPTCGTATNARATNNWTGTNFTITQQCKDSGSGCVENPKKTFTTTTKTHTFTIKDNVGHTNTCTVGVYLDKTAPTCTSSGGSSSWAASRTLKGTCSDAHSGCKKASADGRTYDDNGNVYWTINWDGSWTNLSPGVVYDKVGNSKTCPANQTVKISTKPSKPTINLHGYSSGSWTNKNVTITMSSTSYVGIDHYEYSHDLVNWQRDYDYDSAHWQQSFNSDKSSMTVTISWGGNWDFYVRAVDKNGNVSDVADVFTIRIDKSKPTLGYSLKNDTTWAEYAQGTWSQNGIWRYLYPDDTGGSGVKEVQYNDGDGWHTENYWQEWWLGEMNRTSQYRVIDNAGNVSDVLTLRYMIDWTAPQYTGFESACGDPWENGSRNYVSIYFQDTGSGLGMRYASAWDDRNNTDFPELNYNGQQAGVDIFANKGQWIGYSQTICDVAGNCTSQRNDYVDLSFCW